jgi:hypothetical protein
MPYAMMYDLWAMGYWATGAGAHIPHAHSSRYLGASCLKPQAARAWQWDASTARRIPHRASVASRIAHRASRIARIIAFRLCPFPCPLTRGGWLCGGGGGGGGGRSAARSTNYKPQITNHNHKSRPGAPLPPAYLIASAACTCTATPAVAAPTAPPACGWAAAAPPLYPLSRPEGPGLQAIHFRVSALGMPHAALTFMVRV